MHHEFNNKNKKSQKKKNVLNTVLQYKIEFNLESFQICQDLQTIIVILLVAHI